MAGKEAEIEAETVETRWAFPRSESTHFCKIKTPKIMGTKYNHENAEAFVFRSHDFVP